MHAAKGLFEEYGPDGVTFSQIADGLQSFFRNKRTAACAGMPGDKRYNRVLRGKRPERERPCFRFV